MITRRLVEMHGGISAGERAGLGNTFYVMLPAARPKTGPLTRGSCARPRALRCVLADNRRCSTCWRTGSLEWLPRFAAQLGNDGLSLVHEPPDAIAMDLMLPDPELAGAANSRATQTCGHPGDHHVGDR